MDFGDRGGGGDLALYDECVKGFVKVFCGDKLVASLRQVTRQIPE